MRPQESAIVDLAAFEEALPVAVARTRSLAEFEAWLQSQPGVLSVQVAGYLLKSNPPQRDIIVVLKTADGDVRKIVNVLELDDRRWEFHRLRDE